MVFIFFFFLLGLLGFELRALHLLGKGSTYGTMLLALINVFLYDEFYFT
jgi:hypothetical protein